jgi:hypothetical protein
MHCHGIPAMQSGIWQSTTITNRSVRHNGCLAPNRLPALLSSQATTMRPKHLQAFACPELTSASLASLDLTQLLAKDALQAARDAISGGSSSDVSVAGTAGSGDRDFEHAAEVQDLTERLQRSKAQVLEVRGGRGRWYWPTACKAVIEALTLPCCPAWHVQVTAENERLRHRVAEMQCELEVKEEQRKANEDSWYASMQGVMELAQRHETHVCRELQARCAAAESHTAQLEQQCTRLQEWCAELQALSRQCVAGSSSELQECREALERCEAAREVAEADQAQMRAYVSDTLVTERRSNGVEYALLWRYFATTISCLAALSSCLCVHSCLQHRRLPITVTLWQLQTR